MKKHVIFDLTGDFLKSITDEITRQIEARPQYWGNLYIDCHYLPHGINMEIRFTYCDSKRGLEFSISMLKFYNEDGDEVQVELNGERDLISLIQKHVTI